MFAYLKERNVFSTVRPKCSALTTKKVGSKKKGIGRGTNQRGNPRQSQRSYHIAQVFRWVASGKIEIMNFLKVASLGSNRLAMGPSQDANASQ